MLCPYEVAATMRCPNCQTENPDRNVVCKECGARLSSPTPPTDAERARQLVEEAFRLSDEGKLSQAIAICKRAVAANPNSTSAYSLLGILYERAGQRELAIQAYEAALRLSPESVADRESLQQLASPPTPLVQEAQPARVHEVPAGPHMRPPPVEAPAPRPRVLTWSVVGALAAVFIVLLVVTVQVWRGGKAQPAHRSPPQARFAPQAAPAPARAVVQPPTAAGAPAPPVSVATPPALGPPPPEPVAAAPTEPEPASEPAVTEGPWAAITIPAPETFIWRSPSASEEAPPVSSDQGEVAATGAPAAAPATAEAARARYFEGDREGAIRIYERLTADTTRATPELYQEVGWLYYQDGRRADADAAYRESLRRYQRLLAAGEDVEAAQHGMRTVEAALRVLEVE